MQESIVSICLPLTAFSYLEASLRVTNSGAIGGKLVDKKGSGISLVKKYIYREIRF